MKFKTAATFLLMGLLIVHCGISGSGDEEDYSGLLGTYSLLKLFESSSSFELVSIEPSDGAKNVKVDSKITMTFSIPKNQEFAVSAKYNDCTISSTSSGTKYGVNDGVAALSKDGFKTCLGLVDNQSKTNISVLTPTLNLDYGSSYKFSAKALYPYEKCTTTTTSSGDSNRTCSTYYASIKVSTSFTTETASQNQLFLKGTLIDSTTGSALSLVQVSTNPPTVEVVSDATGNFTISQNVTSTDFYKITFSKTGYKTKIISQKPSSYDSVFNQVTMEQGSGTVDISIVATGTGTGSGVATGTGTATGSGTGTGTGTTVDTSIVTVDSIQGTEEKPTGAIAPPSGGTYCTGWSCYTPLKVGSNYYAIANSINTHNYKWDSNSASWLQITNNKASFVGNYSYTYQSAQICGSKLFIYGGLNYGSSYSTYGYYNPSFSNGYYPDITSLSYDWNSPTSVSAPNSTAYNYRYYPILVCMNNGSNILAFGGRSISSSIYDDFSGKMYSFASDSWTRTVSSINTPSTRYGSIMILSGSHILVWGGISNSTYTQTGSIYDITNNSWTPMPVNNAPTARRSHKAISTGTKVIVWGGVDTSNAYVRTGGIFNPSANTWEFATSTAFAPLPTGSEVVTWTGTEMKVVIGTSTYYYNPTTDIWRQ